MRNPRASAFIIGGAAAALVLLIAAVWITDISTPARLTVTALLILGAVAGVAASTGHGAGSSLPAEADADQRERMRDQVP